MSAWKPPDDLNGLDDYDRRLASDMDDNRPIYGPAPVPHVDISEENDNDSGKPAA